MNKLYNNLKRTISIASWPFALSIIGSIISALSNMVILLLVSAVISEITNQAITQQYDLQSLLNLVYVFILLLPFYFIGMLLSLTGGMKSIKNFRQAIIDSSMRHHEKFIKDGHSASIMAVLTNDTYRIEDFFFQYLNYGIVQPTVHGIIAIILLLTQSTTLALISIVIGIVTVIISTRYSKRVQEADEQSRILMETSTKRLSELIANDDMIRMLNIKDKVSETYHTENTAYSQKVTEGQLLKEKINSFNSIFTVISRTIFLAIGIYLYTQGSLEFGIIFILIPLQASVSQFFTSLSTNYNALTEVSNAAQRCFDIIDTEHEQSRYSLSKLTYDQNNPIISFNDVSFSYPQSEQLFTNLNFDIQKNSTVAFVGESGSGKSTIFQLLLGYFEIESGQINIGHHNTYNHSLQSVREHIVYIEQSAPLFNKSIRENIALGTCTDATDDQIVEAAQKANIHDFIMSLEEGYDTPISSSLNMISGGQRQRIAIARAFMSDAPIIVMDEPTSALDTQSELHIQEALQRLKDEKTVLIAAHRLSTIEDADNIIVLEKGKIIEQGTHEQLLDNRNYYYNLTKTQSH